MCFSVFMLGHAQFHRCLSPALSLKMLIYMHFLRVYAQHAYQWVLIADYFSYC